MHGPTRRAGSVASLRNIKYPSKVAKLVMEQRSRDARRTGRPGLRQGHGLSRGKPAHRAFPHGLDRLEEEPARRRGENNWTDGLDAPENAKAALRELFPNAPEEHILHALDRARNPITGTINCLALNAKGEMSGVTTTSGLSWKIAGRVGDSPIIGARVCRPGSRRAGSTGRGEENIRIAGAHTIVENMRHGMDPKAACLDALKRIARNYNNNMAKLNRFDINFYALRKDGAYASASLWSGRLRRTGFVSTQFAVNDGGASRLEKCAYLLERKG